MVFCFSCGELLVPGVACATCRDLPAVSHGPAADRAVRPGRPVLTLVHTFPRLYTVDPPPHAAA
jgi:hypothetical protein